MLIALDDPLAVLEDLGLQLAADQAALRAWKSEHEHKVQTANVVTNLCASSDNPEHLPAAVKTDVAQTQRYLSEVDACLEQRHMEESEYMESSVRGDALMTPGIQQSREMKAALEARYGTKLTEEDYASWDKRAKWRREVDVEAARSYIARHKPTGDSLAKDVRDTQADLIEWAEHIGLDPHALFVDTTHPGSLLYLQSIMSELLVILAQDITTHNWLLEQEDTATSLFGTMRYGFSPGLKEALHQEADRLLNGLGDYTNLATRIGELNSVLNHPRVTNSSWMLLLKQSVRETLSALGEVVAGEGKSIAETGRFDSASLFGTVNNERPVNALDTMYFPPIPPVQEDVVWHTWVPLNRSARYIELQVWYPQDLIAKNPDSDGYAYQIELSKEADTAGDGLLLSTLAVKKLARSAALTLEIPA